MLLEKNKSKLFWTIIIIVHSCFFYFSLTSANILTKDSSEYLWQAKNIKDASSFYAGDLAAPINPALYNQRPPGYGTFLFLTGSNINSESYFWTLLIQFLISLLNIFIIYKFLNLLSNNKASPLWMLIPLIVFPTQIIYAGMIMSEVIFQTFVILSLYFISLLLKRGEMQYLWWSQWAMTISLLIKPITWLFPFIALGCFIIYWINSKVKLIAVVTFLIPITAMVLMFNYSNKKTGVYEYSSIQRKLMINYNVDAIFTDIHGREKAQEVISHFQDSISKHSYKDKATLTDAYCKSILKNNVLTLLKLEAKGAFNFFVGHSRWDVSMFFSGTEPKPSGAFSVLNNDNEKVIEPLSNLELVYYSFSMIINAVVFLAFIYFLFMWRIPRRIRGCVGVFVLYIVLATGPSASSRFRMPVFPILMIVFALVADDLKHKRSKAIPLPV
jgi:hypothetical protein